MANGVVRGEKRRWWVHLALLVALAGSLLSLIYLSKSITIHVIFGAAFMVFVLFHLYQRRRTVTLLAKQLVRSKGRSKKLGRTAISDTVLELLVVNVLLSGVVDILKHQATQLNFLSAILPPGLIQWHKLASFVLVVYVIVHVVWRRKRLRRSHIQ